MKTSPNVGLNIPEGSDVFNHDTFLKQNFEKIDNYLINTEEIPNINAQLAQIMYLPKNFTQAELKSALLTVPDGGTIKLPKGTYVFNDVVDREFTQGITILGDKGTVIDATANTNMNLFNFHGSKGVGSLLFADAVQYSNSFQTTLAVSPGDILLISSTDLWNPARSYYTKGEMVEVDSVNGTTVTIRGFLADSYTASTTTVYKLNAPKIIIKDLTIKRNSNHMGLTIQYARNIYLENVSVTGARERCLWVDYCFGGEIINCSASDCWFSGSSTSYGLAITSCQYINVKGGKYLGGRHGLTITGAEPNRYINLDGVMVGNYAQGGTQGLDCHGNTEFVNVRGCTILNGLLFNGTSYTITNNRIIASSYINAGLSVQTECPSKNGYLVIENNIINALATSSTGVDIQAIVSNINYKEITVRNNVISANTQGISLNPKDSTCIGFSIELVTIENNDVTCNTAYALLISNQGTTYTHIDKLIIDGGKYVSTAKRALLLSLDATSDVEIKSALLISNDSANYAVVISNGRDITLQSCHIKGLSSAPYSVYNQFNCAGVLRLINNKFENFSANKGIRYDGSPVASMVVLKDNTFTNCTGTIFKGTMPTYSYIDQNGNGVA